MVVLYAQHTNVNRIKAYISAYALLDNHIEHMFSSECDSSDLHSVGTVCVSCCDAFQNLTYPSSKEKCTQISLTLNYTF